MSKTNLVQGSADWLEMRKRKITASDVAILNGTNRWKTPYILWLEKRSVKKPDKPNSAMLHGQRMEMPARETYIANTEVYVLPTVVYSGKWKYGMASLDGVTEDGDLILEVKCPFSNTLYENALNLKIPDYYHDQMQWQLYVQETATRCDYFVYRNELEHMTISVYPDKSYQVELLAKAKLFMGLILANEKPEMRDSDVKFIYKIISKTKPTDWDKFAMDYGLNDSELEKYRKKSISYT